jgi:hypothetical protein
MIPVAPDARSTLPPAAGMKRLEASREGRRTANIIALLLVCFATTTAAGAALVLLRSRGLYPVDIRWLLYFSTTFSVLYLLWFAYFFYLPAHTVLEFSSASLRLTRSLPFRAWSGSWRAVRQSYLHKGFFAIRTTERLCPGWAIKVAPTDVLLIEELKRYLGPGVWLGDRQARLRFAGRVLLAQVILIVLTLLGGRLVNFIERAFH